VHSITAIRPYWWVRTFTGISMDVGMSLLVYALMKTSQAARAAAPQRTRTP
jgi:cytochrome c oxidase cbb3-type subunit 1